MNRDDLLIQLKSMLEELFEISPDKVMLETRLYEDLDLDSIDAVDLIVHLQTLTGRRIKPEEFKAVKTVSDVLDCLERLMAEDPDFVVQS